jgi:two-component system nitrogen regulation sensor histidine kinase NtrY
MSRLQRRGPNELLRDAGIVVAAVVVIGVVFMSEGPATRAIAVGLLIGLLTLAHVKSGRRMEFGLKTIASIIEAIGKGDYTSRVREETFDPTLGVVASDLNRLADSLHHERLQQLEATALLRAVVEGIDAAVFAFDIEERLTFVNPAGAQLLRTERGDAVGRHTSEIEGGALTSGPTVRSFGGEGKWQLRRSVFRDEGLSRQLVVAIDLSRALREEERLAWQKVLRVITHELNNSVAPIRSLTTSARVMLQREELPEDWRHDLSRALEAIGTRTDALARFTQSYAQLARLPPPKVAPLSIQTLVERVVTLEQHSASITIAAADDVTIVADASQLEQLLTNLVRNAAEAMASDAGSVAITWSSSPDNVEISVIDDGCGIDGTTNLFVPFFTTKPAGSGIGLVLSRQIAEAHGGSLTLTSRTEGRGTRAIVKLPIGRSWEP